MEHTHLLYTKEDKPYYSFNLEEMLVVDARFTPSGLVSKRKKQPLKNFYFNGILETGANIHEFWAVFQRGKDALITNVRLDHKKQQTTFNTGVMINTPNLGFYNRNIVFASDTFYFIDSAMTDSLLTYDTQKQKAVVIHNAPKGDLKYVYLAQPNTLVTGNFFESGKINLDNLSYETIDKREKNDEKRQLIRPKATKLSDKLRYHFFYDENWHYRFPLGVIDEKTNTKFHSTQKAKEILILGVAITHDAKILHPAKNVDKTFLNKKNGFLLSDIELVEQIIIGPE